MAVNFPYTIVSKGFAWTLKAKLNNKLALCSEVEGRRSFLEMSLNPSCSTFSGPFPKLHALLKDPVDSIAPPSRFSLTPFEAAFVIISVVPGDTTFSVCLLRIIEMSV